jgi:hypothetical protein
MSARRSDELWVFPLYDDGDEVCELMSRGHHDRAEFLAAANAEWAHIAGADPFVEGDVEHEWRRVVPEVEGAHPVRYVPASRGRGAFRVTVIDVNCPATSRTGSAQPAAEALVGDGRSADEALGEIKSIDCGARGSAARAERERSGQ